MRFTLYVNDLFRVPKDCKPLGYVDDTKLFLGFPFNKLHDVISAVNEDPNCPVNAGIRDADITNQL